jgi:hypothetical protein
MVQTVIVQSEYLCPQKLPHFAACCIEGLVSSDALLH